MSLCSRPSKTEKTNFSTPATKTVNPPAARAESCGPATSSVVSGGGSSTSTTVTVPGPAGPAGPAGAAGAAGANGADGTNGTNGTNGLDGWGLEWKGAFALNVQYYKQADNQFGSVVEYNGSSYVAILDNISVTEENPEFEPGLSPAWHLLAQKGVAGGDGTVSSLPGFNLADAYNWFKNASVTDLISAGIAAVGVIIAGVAISDMMSGDGTGDGSADQRYTGSDGFNGTYTAPTLPDVLAALCEQALIAYDVSLLPPESCEFCIGNATSTRSIIQQLSLVYGFDMVDTGTALKFIPRNATSLKTLTLADMGFASGLVPSPKFVASRFQGIDLPKTITVKYNSYDLDYNTFTQQSELFPYTTGQDVTIEVPLTLSNEKAKVVAELALVNAHLERQTYTFTTTYRHIDLEPGDVFTTPMGLLRTTKIQETNEGLVEVTAVEAGGELAVEGSGMNAVSPPVSSNKPIVIGYSQGLFIDPPVMSASDTGVRIYCAVHGYDAVGWPGAQAWMSDDNGATYSVLASTSQESTVGMVASPVANRDYHVWDETTTISVTLKTNTLGSVSEISVLNGTNWALIGNEVIGFKNAVLTGPKTYTLSGLLRGRQGTEQFTGTHAVNELFVLLDGNVLKISLANADKSKTRKYKVVTNGSSLDKVDAVDVQAFSNNTRQWTVYGQKALKIGADYQFSWHERSRYDNKLRDYAVSPRDSDWGGALVVIYDTDGITIKKSYPSTSGIYTYTEAQQITDFGSAQATIKAAIAQYSNVWGAGYPVVVTA
jgi:hypothetical protein